MNRIVLMATLLFITICSSAAVGAVANTVKAADLPPAPIAATQEEDTQVVIDITSGLLKINERVLQNLGRFLPASETAAIVSARKHFGQLREELSTDPDTVLAAKQDDQLEALLKKYGPGDPFVSLPFFSVDELQPGDILLRCSTALASQMTEVMIWSRYTHSALYIGNGMIVDSTWEGGVKVRSLADFLGESSRVGVLRLPGLTSEQADLVIAAAKSKAGSAYNFEGVKTLGVQKLDALTNLSRQSLGEMIGVLGRAEQLPADGTASGKYACSELIAAAFKAIGIPLSQANGFTPGDMVRLSQAGFLSAAGRLQVPAK